MAKKKDEQKPETVKAEKDAQATGEKPRTEAKKVASEPQAPVQPEHAKKVPAPKTVNPADDFDETLLSEEDLEPVNKPKKPKKRAEKKLAPKLSATEIEETIVSLANAGHTTSEIGLQLRDQYGVGKTKPLLKKTITEILAAHKLLGEVPEDLMALVRKSVLVKRHLAANAKDMSAKRGYQLTVSKIRRLSKYYSSKGALPATWRYSEETAELLVK